MSVTFVICIHLDINNKKNSSQHALCPFQFTPISFTGESIQRFCEKDMKNVCNATDETVLYNNSTGTGPNILYNATDKTILHSNSIGTEFPKEVIIGVVPVLIVTIIMVVVCIFYRRKNKAVDVSYPEESLYSDPNCIQYAQLQLAEPQPNSYLSQRENVGYSEIIGVLKPQQ
ncbi:uncharacterized protein LOC131850755 isoform X1 [Achroia grisella]|uniref:uncharacterized protein LOC131850755 isoform X1 n=1 Tax=Achroia grisella TaxID=688607 RepID=UPI0027D1FEAC|nr:uncharacterized protein LOC131850755 isoform X1 [Achroia grisella]